jgi:hypothetical protein
MFGWLAIVPLLSIPATQAAPVGEPAAPAFTLRVERRVERFDYHVENPSRVADGPLVPHAFDHRYDSDNTWMLLRADYRVAGVGVATEAGVTPAVTTSGSDVDTFFQPSGDVITSGTRGQVRLRAFSIRQWIEMSRWRAWRLGVTVGYRRSKMDFLPSDRIVTHSQPPSETREPVGGDETTWSHVVESGVTASRALALGGWRLDLGAEALPITRARLVVSLPLKYPGEPIRQDTFGIGARGEASLERHLGRVTLGASVSLAGAWGYREKASYHERRTGAALFIAWPR